MVLDKATVTSQLMSALTIQNEHLGNANVINWKNQIMVEEQDEKKKDRTKKLLPAILNMLKRAVNTIDCH